MTTTMLPGVPFATTTTTAMSTLEAWAAGNGHSVEHTVAVMVSNLLESYDFNVFGFFSDVIGDVFFPPSDNSTFQAFVVYGAAFLIRPFGGVFFGYLGDMYGRKVSVISSVVLMGLSTFVLGCLPGYDEIGNSAGWLLLVFRLLQGFSVGGQLLSSLVYTIENQDPGRRGYYGGFVFSSASLGTVVGGIIATILRESMSDSALHDYGWRIPFWIGIVAFIPGVYLNASAEGDGDFRTNPKYHPLVPADTRPDVETATVREDDDEQDGEYDGDKPPTETQSNPLWTAFSRENWRPLLASCLVPALGAGAFYLIFVWMAIFMEELSDNPVSHAFAVNTASLLFSYCMVLPMTGLLSDVHGRDKIIGSGAVALGILSPPLFYAISLGNWAAAFFSQCTLGFALSLYRAPIGAWLVEAFPPEARLTSISIGYNVGAAIVGGFTPALATYMVDNTGQYSPGYIITVLAIVSLFGLWYVAPPRPTVSRKDRNGGKRPRKSLA